MKRPLLPKEEKETCSQWRRRIIYTVIFVVTTLAAIFLFNQIDKEKPLISWDNAAEVPVGQELFTDAMERAVGKSLADWKAGIAKELNQQLQRKQFVIQGTNNNLKAPVEQLLKEIDTEFANWNFPAGPNKVWTNEITPKAPAWNALTEALMMQMLDKDPSEPDRKTLMLWSGDFRFNKNIRKQNSLYRLELTVFGLAMGKLLGNEIFKRNCDDFMYGTFVGSLFDKASKLLVNSYKQHDVVVALSERLPPKYKTKTFFRQEAPAILSRDSSITEIKFYIRDKNGHYVDKLGQGGKQLTLAQLKTPAAVLTLKDKTTNMKNDDWTMDGIFKIATQLLGRASKVSVGKEVAVGPGKCGTDEMCCNSDNGDEQPQAAHHYFGCTDCDGDTIPWEDDYNLEIYGPPKNGE